MASAQLVDDEREDWVDDDLVRIANKIAEFQSDLFVSARHKVLMRNQLSRTLHAFEELTGTTVL